MKMSESPLRAAITMREFHQDLPKANAVALMSDCVPVQPPQIVGKQVEGCRRHAE